MGMKNFNEVVTTVGGIPVYQTKFKAVFGGSVTMIGIQQAIASYERTQVTFIRSQRRLLT